MDKESFSDEFLEWYFSPQSAREIKKSLMGPPWKVQFMKRKAVDNFRVMFAEVIPGSAPSGGNKRAEQAFRFMFDPDRKFLYLFKRARGKSPKWAIDAQKRYYEKHHDELLAKIRERRKRDRVRIREYQRQWSAMHRNRNLKKYHKYYEKHRQQRIEYRKKYYEEHREEILRKKREKDRSKAPREIEPDVVATANSNDVL